MKTEKHYLSKSTYIRGLQCLKSLYLHKKRPFLRDRLSPLQMAKYKRGHQIGLLARQKWPGGIDLSPASPSQYRQAVARTMEAMQSGQADVLYEACFQFNQVLVMMDILVKEESAWVAYEVKSSLQVSETYLEDAALQYFIITAAGVSLSDIRIIHLNPDYCREDKVDMEKLFRWESVLEFAKGRRHFIEQRISQMLSIQSLTTSPDIPTGHHCFKPYDCDFIGHCWKSQKHPAEESLEYWANAWRNAVTADKGWVNSGQSTVCLSFFTTRPAIPLLPGNKPYQALLAGIGMYDVQHKTSERIIANIPEYPAVDILDKVLKWTRSYDFIFVEDKAEFDKQVEHLTREHPEYAVGFAAIENKTLGLKEWIRGDALPEDGIGGTSFPGAIRLLAHLQAGTASDRGKIEDASLAGEVFRLLYLSDQTERHYQHIDLEQFLTSQGKALALLLEKGR
jgi:hypothetical protein